MIAVSQKIVDSFGPKAIVLHEREYCQAVGMSTSIVKVDVSPWLVRIISYTTSLPTSNGLIGSGLDNCRDFGETSKSVIPSWFVSRLKDEPEDPHTYIYY